VASGVSFPKIEKNSIFGNISSGVIIRDNSSAMIVNKKVTLIELILMQIFSNYYQVSTIRMNKERMTNIEEDNEIEGEVEVLGCAIF
jgi:hypothetical protein